MKLFFILSTLFAMASATAALAAQKILVVLSAADRIELKGGTTPEIGFYLNELTVPLKTLIDAGYEPVFVTPGGAIPHLDPTSDDPKYFGGDKASYQAHKDLLSQLFLLDKEKSPVKNIALFADKDFSDYAAVFVPGGHAPMVDLIKDPSLGKILRTFHSAHKTTALICHGPASLISAMPNADKYVAALKKGDKASAHKLAQGWIYKDYPMTVFSNPEDETAEKKFHANMYFFPEDALRIAGGKVSTKAPWTSFTVLHNELLTGQNPQSDEEFAKLLVKILAQKTEG